MKTLKLLPILFSVLFLVSCSEDDEVPVPSPDSCRPIKITNSADGATEEATLTYDAQGRISKAILSGGEMQGEMNIQYTNNLPSAATITNLGTTVSTMSFTYDAQKRLVKQETEIDLLGLYAETNFEYNGQNKVSKAVEYAYFVFDEDQEPMGGFSQYTTFTYDAKGNITKKSIYEGETEATATLTYTIDYTYDNAPNPGYNVDLLFLGYSTPNNVLTAVHKDNGVLDKDLSYAVVYQYNPSGLPTQATETTQNGDVTVGNITYSCN